MKTDIWMPWYPSDYLRDTMHLSLEEDAFYRRALDASWVNPGLPLEENRIKRILRVSDDEWKRCSWVLKEFFIIKNEKYFHNRIQSEKEKADSRANNARNNGRLGGRPKNNPEITQWDQMVSFFGNKCLKCLYVFPEGESPTKDHIIPTAKGGIDHISNYQPLCRQCNSSKCADNSIDYRIKYKNIIPKNLQDLWFNYNQEITQPVFSGFEKQNPEKSSSPSPSPSQSQSTTQSGSGDNSYVSSDEKNNDERTEKKRQELELLKKQELDVFDYWKKSLNHPKCVLDEKRSAAIRARLKKGYSVERIKEAIDGIKNSPHNMGQNDRNTVFDDIELICRSGANVDRFAEMKKKVNYAKSNFEKRAEGLFSFTRGAPTEGGIRGGNFSDASSLPSTGDRSNAIDDNV